MYFNKKILLQKMEQDFFVPEGKQRMPERNPFAFYSVKEAVLKSSLTALLAD
jgi:hypothetical protein